MASLARRDRNAVPWPHSCQRGSADEPYSVPYTANAGIAHHEPMLQNASTPAAAEQGEPQHDVARGTAVGARRQLLQPAGSIGGRYHWASARPSSTARRESGPVRL